MGNKINGEKYYISLGHIDNDYVEDDFNIDLVDSLITDDTDGTYYVKNKNNKHTDFVVPLLPITKIKDKSDSYEFTYIVNPNELKWFANDNHLNSITINVIGLFSCHREYGKTEVKKMILVYFPTPIIINEYTKHNITIPINIEKSIILGE